MGRPRNFWTKERVIREALKYKRKSDFHNNAPGAYAAAKKNGWFTVACIHMKKLNSDWTKEAIHKKAKEFNSRETFRRQAPTAYKQAISRQWLDDVCVHMKRPGVSKGYWTKGRVQKLALMCQTRSDFNKAYKNAYQAAQRNGWLQDVCSHMSYMKRRDGYWTKEVVHQKARQFKTRKEFSIGEPTAYAKARNKQWLDEVCSHMAQQNHHWSKKEVHALALLCKTRKEFHGKHKHAYQAAQRHNWLDDVCNHMVSVIRPPNYWSLHRVRQIALRFETRMDFYLGNKNAYAAAHRNSWLNDVCSHMRRCGDRLSRCIYVLVSESAKEAYVGLTFDYDKRMLSHMSGHNKSTFKLVQNRDLQSIRLTDYLPAKEAVELEKHYFGVYKKWGYSMLNSFFALGGLGGSVDYWDYDSVLSVAMNYTTKKDFRANYPGAYSTAKKNDWLEGVCSHMEAVKKPRSYWTKDRLKAEALRHKSRTEFAKKSCGAANVAREKGWMDEVCQHMLPPKSYRKWTFERVQKEANKYKTKKEFSSKSPRASSAAYRNGWMESISRHMKSSEFPRKWTFERVQKEAAKYITRTEFTSNSSAAASAAKKNGWMDSVCEHMVSGRSGKAFWTFERVSSEALKYSTKKEFRQMAGSAVAVAQRNGWMNLVCAHMKELRKRKGYWGLETIKEEALRYSSRMEFNRKAKGAYTIAHRKGWLDEVCAHMG